MGIMPSTLENLISESTLKFKGSVPESRRGETVIDLMNRLFKTFDVDMPVVKPLEQHGMLTDRNNKFVLPETLTNEQVLAISHMSHGFAELEIGQLSHPIKFPERGYGPMVDVSLVVSLERNVKGQETDPGTLQVVKKNVDFVLYEIWSVAQNGETAFLGTQV